MKKLLQNVTIGRIVITTWLLVLCFDCMAQNKIDFVIATNEDSTSFKKYNGDPLNKEQYYWLKFEIPNPEVFDQTYIVYSSAKWGEALLFANNQVKHAGSLLPLNERSYPRAVTAFKIVIEKNTIQTIYLRLQGKLSIYTPKLIDLRYSILESYEQNDKTRLWLQAIFVGIVVIMVLYNFLLYVAVRDVSYLFYVISILGIGLYFFFYYGFGIELLWQNAPKWDTYAFAFIIPITNLARIYFTKSYLHLRETSLLINKSLTILSWLCLLLFLFAAICFSLNLDLLDLLVDLIGLLGTAVLTLMLIAGIIVARKGYSPATYFVAANLILVFGGNLFIIRELNWIPDNTLTRYAVQYGVLAQVVLFSLGLSNRLNQAQIKVTQLELDKERERKQMLQEQSQLLIQKVAEQTSDLRSLNQLKNKLLSIISHDLRNPLVSLDSFLNLLINHHDRLSELERTTLTQKARQSLGNLNQLLSNLLLWSRSQMNQVSFNPRAINIQDIINNAIKLQALDIELKNIKIQTDVQTSEGLWADVEMIDFIVRNLLGNAIKFSYKGGLIQILVTHDANYFIVCVIDEGIGLSQEQVGNILKSNVISSTRGTAKEKGSGLGLSLCKEFLETHQGKLTISTHNKTKFCCYFPLK